MRLIFAAEEQLHADTLADLRLTISDLRVQNADLLATVLALKVQGAHEPVPVRPLPKKANPIADVIADVAGNNGPLRKQLGAFARRAKAEGTPDADITHKLLNWDADEDGVAE